MDLRIGQEKTEHGKSIKGMAFVTIHNTMGLQRNQRGEKLCSKFEISPEDLFS